MSVALLLQKPWFFHAISFFPRKAQDFGASKAHFRPQSLRIRGQSERKDSGDENSNSFGTRTSFLGGPRLPPEVVSARLNFSARGPKNLLLHGKNQACRGLYYWPACQNLGVPYPKWMSCKCALNMITDPDPDHPKGHTTDNWKPQDTFNWLINASPVKLIHEILLSPSGSNRVQSIQGLRKVRKDWTAAYWL